MVSCGRTGARGTGSEGPALAENNTQVHQVPQQSDSDLAAEWQWSRDSANDIHGGRWCRQVGRVHDHGDYVKGGRIQQIFSRGSRDSRYGLRGVRAGEASSPGQVQTRQARRAEHGQFIADRRVLVREDDEPLQDTTQDSMSTTRSRCWCRHLRLLPWSWDSDSELDGLLSASRGRQTPVPTAAHFVLCIAISLIHRQRNTGHEPLPPLWLKTPGCLHSVCGFFENIRCAHSSPSSITFAKYTDVVRAVVFLVVPGPSSMCCTESKGSP